VPTPTPFGAIRFRPGAESRLGSSSMAVGGVIETQPPFGDPSAFQTDPARLSGSPTSRFLFCPDYAWLPTFLGPSYLI